MEYRVKVDKQGNRFWYNEQGQQHRLDGPAVEHANGSCIWYLNDQLHRTDGPAVESANGHREWYVNGRLHRLDGAAIEYADGHREWYVNGQRHRLDGAAIEYADGSCSWWVNGEWLSEQQFLAHTDKLKAKTCEGRVIEIDGKKYRLTAM